MIIDIITIFPKMFTPVIGESIIKRAVNKGLVKINIHDLRDYADNEHKKVDAPSYGGGGMVFMPAPIFAAVEDVLQTRVYPKPKKDKNTKIIFFSPKGKVLTQELIEKFLGCERLVLIAGRYEGIDERAHQHLADEEISIGDYVLSGAELAAMVFIDSLVRLVPGVVSDQESIKKESFQGGLLDYPHWTRPQNFRGLKVPEVLVSGNHKEVEAWRRQKARQITKKRRPDLLDKRR